MGATTHYIPRERLKSLSRRSDLWGWGVTLHVWGVIFGAMAMFSFWPNVFTFILAFAIIASRQHGMSVLMHDAAHGVLFKTKFLNEWVGTYLLGAPYGGDMASYRKYHLKHHKYAQSERDPDLPLSAKFPTSPASLRRKFLRDISGLTFLRIKIASLKMRFGNHAQIDGADAFKKTSPWPTLITNVILFGVLATLGKWWVYPLLWLLPLGTLFFAIIRLRNIAEHGMTTFDDNPLTHARTTRTHLLSRIFISPYWVNYHIEHHAYMYVPCYRLKALHHEMGQAGHYDEMDIKTGYTEILKLASLRQSPLAS